MNELTLRPAQPEDENFLLELYTSGRTRELTAIGWNAAQIREFCEMQYRAQVWQYDLTFSGAVDQIVELNGQAIGRLKVFEDNTMITVVDIALLSSHQNKGIGTRLLEQLKMRSRCTLKPVRLHVLVTSPGIRLYERLGFTRLTHDGAYIEMEYQPQSDAR